MTMGHEISGVVAELGEGVHDSWRGARVVTETYFSPCGHCVHCLSGRRNLCLERRYRPLVQAGYALSGLATVLHVAEAFRANASYHRWAMISITIGFGILSMIAAVLVYREQHDRATTSRVVGTMSLFLLAMSFVHLGSGHARQVWSH